MSENLLTLLSDKRCLESSIVSSNFSGFALLGGQINGIGLKLLQFQKINSLKLLGLPFWNQFRNRFGADSTKNKEKLLDKIFGRTSVFMHCRQDGLLCVKIAQRSDGKSFTPKFQLPGRKVEKNELPQEAIHRLLEQDFATLLPFIHLQRVETHEVRARQKGDSKREKPDPERTFSQIFADFR